MTRTQRAARALGSALRSVARRARRLPWRRLRPRTRNQARVVCAFVLAVIWWTQTGPSHAAVETWPRQQILDAIRFVESGNRQNPPDGDDGLAIGPYQIHRIYWRDAVAFDPSLATEPSSRRDQYQRCRDRAYAERTIDAYMRRHAPEAWQQGDGETIARIHNGGPRGRDKTATEGYWRRVRARLGEPR